MHVDRVVFRPLRGLRAGFERTDVDIHALKIGLPQCAILAGFRFFLFIHRPSGTLAERLQHFVSFRFASVPRHISDQKDVEVALAATRFEFAAHREQIPCRHGSHRTQFRCRIYDCTQFKKARTIDQVT